jgi:hypothetical protein
VLFSKFCIQYSNVGGLGAQYPLGADYYTFHRLLPHFSVHASVNYDSILEWSKSCRNHGIQFLSGRTLKCSLDELKIKHFHAYNAILVKSVATHPKRLFGVYYVQIAYAYLLYAIEARPLLEVKG